MTREEVIQKRDIIVTQVINELGVTIETNTKPLVRCRECKHYLPMQKNSSYARHRCYCNKGAIKATNPDDFCSYGERSGE